MWNCVSVMFNKIIFYYALKTDGKIIKKSLNVFQRLKTYYT